MKQHQFSSAWRGLLIVACNIPKPPQIFDRSLDGENVLNFINFNLSKHNKSLSKCTVTRIFQVTL